MYDQKKHMIRLLTALAAIIIVGGLIAGIGPLRSGTCVITNNGPGCLLNNENLCAPAGDETVFCVNSDN